jgi:hypothetical protein
MSDPEILARISALEAKVAQLFELVDVVEPSNRDAVAASVPAEVRELFAAGERDAAIRRLIELDGSSLKTAMGRVDALEFGSGR